MNEDEWEWDVDIPFDVGVTRRRVKADVRRRLWEELAAATTQITTYVPTSGGVGLQEDRLADNATWWIVMIYPGPGFDHTYGAKTGMRIPGEHNRYDLPKNWIITC